MTRARCIIDPLAEAADLCGDCGNPFEDRRLVWPHGPGEPPLCRWCATRRAGLPADRGPAPAMGRRQLRRLRRAHAAAVAAARRRGEPLPRLIDVAHGHVRRPTPAPAPAPAPVGGPAGVEPAWAPVPAFA